MNESANATAPPAGTGGGLAEKAGRLKDELGKVIIGQEQVVEDVILGLFCGEHILLTGVPGLAKTLLIHTLADALHLGFKRIQFTPDLMPSDITGTEIIQEDPDSGTRQLKFVEGPVFTNLLLADEINRTPPKTQAAMLQTMQERQVSVGGVTHDLPRPFHVFATQNPIEMEGTYNLPEAASDRFMLSVRIHYPSTADEVSVVRATTGTGTPDVQTTITGDDLIDIQQTVRAVPVSEELIHYAVRLVSATRPDSEFALPATKTYVRWGAGPRASQYLILGAKGRAAMRGQPCVSAEDIRSVAVQVLEHRVLTNFKARTQGVDTARVIEDALEAVPERENQG